MGRVGFIQDKLEIKFLILYITARVIEPIPFEVVLDLTLCDDAIDYFDFSECLNDLVKTGHLTLSEEGLYAITEKGRENVEITGDSVAFTVRERAKAAVETFNRESTRSGHVRTEILERDGVFAALLELHDGAGKLMSMELTAPSRKQARKLAAAFHRSAEQIYSAVLEDLLSDEEA